MNSLFPNLVSSKSAPIKGQLYKKQEDFIVREILNDGTSLNEQKKNNLDKVEGKSLPYVYITLVKKGISTFNVMGEFESFIPELKGKIGYAGLKDTFGLTSQSISIPTELYFGNIKKLKQKKFKHFFIKDPRYQQEAQTLRNIYGNSFEITVRNVFCSKKDLILKLNEVLKDIKNNLPNFYGPQRFGKRQHNHLIAKSILKKDYKNALKLFLTYSNNESRKVMQIRKEIYNNFDKWEICKKIIGNNKELVDELKTIEYLIINKEDYPGALNVLPFIEIYICSYSSFIYNLGLKKLLKEKVSFKSLPLVGNKIEITPGKIKKVFNELLIAQGVSQEDYINKDFPRMSYSGRYKEAFYKVTNFNYCFKSKNLILKFDLPSGVYASLFLDNFIDNSLSKRRVKYE